MMNEYVPWLALALIGAFHGPNPGMGWLFAVALGLQEGSRSAVVRSFGPIAAGHAASIATVVAVTARARLVPGSGAHQRRTVRARVPLLVRPSSDKSSIGTSRAPRHVPNWTCALGTAAVAGISSLGHAPAN
jgi:hypothetical protein